MDCLDFMKGYPDGYFDLAIVDPPYGINAANMQMGSNPKRSRSDGHGSGPAVSTSVKLKGRLNQGSGKLKNRLLNQSGFDWDNEVPGPEYFTELFRVSKNQIIWGGNYFDLPPTRCIICWDKMQPWENFSQWEMAWTSFDKPAKMFKLSNTGGRNNEKKIHPTQKPVKLYEWILKEFGASGDKIIDTHLGSGSSRIAAFNMGFEFTGIEKCEAYLNDQEERFKLFKSQTQIFNQFNPIKQKEIMQGIFESYKRYESDQTSQGVIPNVKGLESMSPYQFIQMMNDIGKAHRLEGIDEISVAIVHTKPNPKSVGFYGINKGKVVAEWLAEKLYENVKVCDWLDFHGFYRPKWTPSK